MAVLANTYLTYDSKGNREDLGNIIWNTDPEDTPFFSRAPKPRGSASLIEWQTESLATAVTTNQVVQGNDITSVTAVTPTVRVGNYYSIAEATFAISRTQEAIEKAGRTNEASHQTMKNGKQIRRDIESHLLANKAGVGGATATAAVAASMAAWIKTNDSLGAGGASPTYTSGVPGGTRTDGTQRAFTETIHKEVLQSMYTNGAENNLCMTGPFNKGVLSGFSGIATATYNQEGRRPAQAAIIGGADVYRGDFGLLVVEPNRFQRERDVWYIDPDFYDIPQLRPLTRDTLAKTGDATKYLMNTEYSLRVKNEQAFGLAADLNTS